jgi:putative sterol carrier protein
MKVLLPLLLSLFLASCGKVKVNGSVAVPVSDSTHKIQLSIDERILEMIENSCDTAFKDKPKEAAACMQDNYLKIIDILNGVKK